MSQILIKPIVTERSMQDAALGRFTFQVGLKANKHDIAASVGKAFNVHPTAVRTQIVKGVRKRSARSRTYFQTPASKKAVVSLKLGEKIELFDVTEQGHDHPIQK